MRKIEHDMIQAIRDGKVWSKDNTVVDIVPVMGSMGNDPDKYCADVYLHGSNIARLIIRKERNHSVKGHGIHAADAYWHPRIECIEVSFAGYQTNTTKSRINALIQAFSINCIGVVQKKGALYMVTNGGNLKLITNNDWYAC